jgi:hypothetical protein
VKTPWEPIKRLTRDIRDAAITLSRAEARYLVDYYYQMQEEGSGRTISSGRSKPLASRIR